LNNNKLDNFYNFLELKNYKEAEIEIIKLLSVEPNNCQLLNNYANILYLQNNFLGAINQFKKVIKIEKNSLEANYNIATLYLKLFLFQDAKNYYLKTLKIKKDHFESHFNLATCFINLKRFDESIHHLNQCLKYNPDDFEIYNNLGSVYLEKEMNDEAIINFNKCISLKMDFVKAYNNLGIAYYKKEQYQQSISILERGINIDKNFSSLYFNLAKSLKSCNQYIKAIDVLKKYKNYYKDFDFMILLGSCLCEIGNISEGIKLLNKSLELKNDNKKDAYVSKIFFMNYLEDFNLEEYFKTINKLKKFFFKDKKKSIFFNVKKIRKNIIKVGFVTSDFREHAVGFQVFEVIKYLSENSDIELFAYYNNYEEDFLTKKFKNFFKNWIVVKNIEDQELIRIIRQDNIDILIDLSGFSKGNRLGVFFNKAAPIQISWAGYLASTGLDEIDYVISDKNSVSIKEENQFVERVIKLNDTWSVLMPEHEIVLEKFAPSLKNRHITFGSFNEIKKINQSMIKIWSDILCNINNSKLILLSYKFNEKEFKNLFTKRFLDKGVNSDQLIFDNGCDRKDLLNKYNLIDIALDTFPYNGGTTTLEASWMCVPTLVKRGNSFLSKCGESINISLGLNDWIAENDDDYINKAINFSKNIDKIQNTKSYLINNRIKFKIFNAKIFSEELVKIFKDIISTKYFNA
jgi:predicted O-linked N-acetylglucosamine transferase (SPINDLY family)